MTTPWIRAATIASKSLKRDTVAVLLSRTSGAVPHGLGYHTQNKGSKIFYAPINYESFLYSPMHGVRAYCEKTPGPVPSPPNLPDKAQMERAFFRVVAFFWDYGLWLLIWMRKMIQLYVVDKPMVKLYWKRFHEKMEEAKKDT